MNLIIAIYIAITILFVIWLLGAFADANFIRMCLLWPLVTIKFILKENLLNPKENFIRYIINLVKLVYTIR